MSSTPTRKPKTKQSAHAQLDQLRQQAAAERVNERELAAQLEAAKVAVDDAGAAVTEAYAADDAKLAQRRRQEVDAAAAEVLDLQHRFDAAGLRVERAQTEADTFQVEHARELLDEREPEARTLAERLTRAGLEVAELHRAYRAMRTDIDSLVAAVPGATSRADGPAPSHPWESVLQDLARVTQEHPEVPPPLPQWAGLSHRHAQDHAHGVARDKRSGETAAAVGATSGPWVTVK
jgi:hypothetical protein